MKKIHLILAILFLAVFLISCTPEAKEGSPFHHSFGSLYDSRDGKSYRTVTIGGQTWMAENLNYDASGSVCYDNQNSYCDTYGRLYNWESAMIACPSGWRLPSYVEWEALCHYADGDTNYAYNEAVDGSGIDDMVASRHLRATSGWYNNGNGLDIYGFAALPGGEGYSDGNFYGVGHFGYWWTDKLNSNFGEEGFVTGFGLGIGVESMIWLLDGGLLSVRCVQD